MKCTVCGKGVRGAHSIEEPKDNITRGDKLEVDIWEEFSNDLNKLKLASQLIKSNIEIYETVSKMKRMVSKKGNR